MSIVKQSIDYCNPWIESSVQVFAVKSSLHQFLTYIHNIYTLFGVLAQESYLNGQTAMLLGHIFSFFSLSVVVNPTFPLQKILAFILSFSKEQFAYKYIAYYSSKWHAISRVRGNIFPLPLIQRMELKIGHPCSGMFLMIKRSSRGRFLKPR